MQINALLVQTNATLSLHRDYEKFNEEKLFLLPDGFSVFPGLELDASDGSLLSVDLNVKDVLGTEISKFGLTSTPFLRASLVALAAMVE